MCQNERGSEREAERLNKSYHTLFLFAQTLAICLTLLLLRRDMLAISASAWVHAWVCVCVRVSVSVCLGGVHRCQTCPTVSPGTILYSLICAGRRKAECPADPGYSSALISSAFRLYLDSFCVFFFLHVQLENIQTFFQIFDLLTSAAILKNKINYFYSLELVCQMLTCQLHVSASNFFPFLYFFSQFFFPAKQWQL